MKNKILLSIMSLVLVVLIVASCKKQNEIADIKATLKENMSFRNFVARDISQKMKLIDQSVKRGLSPSTRMAIQNEIAAMPESSEEALKTVYDKYGLSIEPIKGYILMNMAEQVVLFEKIPTLNRLPDDELKTTLQDNYRAVARNLIEKATPGVLKRLENSRAGKTVQVNGLRQRVNDEETQSGFSDDWGTYYNAVPTDMTETEIVTVVEGNLYDVANDAYVTNGLTAMEIVHCVAEAVLGFFVDEMFQNAMNSLSSMATSQIVKTVAKFIGKYAGWWSAAILIYDFGSCIYDAARD